MRLLERLTSAYLSDSSAGSLARGSTWSGVFQGGAMVLGALVQLILARVLGETEYGRYAYVLGWMSIAVLFTAFELQPTAVRFAALYSAAGEWGLLRGFQRLAFRISGGLSVGVAATAATCIWLLSARMPPAMVPPALAACATLPVVTLLGVQSGILLGRGRVASSQLQMALRPALFLSLLLVAVFVIDARLDSARALGLGWTAATTTLLVTALLVRRASSRVRAARPRFRSREWLGMAAGLVPGSFAQLTLGTAMDVVIVGSFAGPAAAGIYSISTLLLQPQGVVSGAVVTIAAPMFADLYARERHVELRRLVKLVTRVSVIVTIPGVLIAYALGPLVLRWFGPSYVQGYPVLLILGVATMAGSFGHAGTILSMTGNHYALSLIIVASAAVNLVLAFALVPFFGLIGVASATAIAVVVRAAALIVAARRRTGVNVLRV